MKLIHENAMKAAEEAPTVRGAVIAFRRNVEPSSGLLREMARCSTDKERFSEVCGCLADELLRGTR